MPFLVPVCQHAGTARGTLDLMKSTKRPAEKGASTATANAQDPQDYELK
jgi:hypothetical protein